MSESLSQNPPQNPAQIDIPRIKAPYIEPDLHFIHFLKLLKRNARLILLCFGISILAMTAFILVMPPQYKSHAQILISSEQPSIPGMQAIQFLTKGGDSQLYTEAEILRSDRLIREVVGSLSLQNDQSFLDVKAPNSALLLPLARAKLQKNLDVRVVPGASIISVEVTDQDRARAAKIANKISELYLLERRTRKKQEIKGFNEWLEHRYDDVKRQVKASKQELKSHKMVSGSVSPADLQLLNQRIATLNESLTQQRIEFSRTYARMQDLKNYKHGKATRDVLSSTIIQRLKEAELEIQDELLILTQRYGEKHPLIIDVKERLETIRQQIMVEVGNIRSVLESDLDGYENVINDIESRLATLTQQKELARKQVEEQATLQGQVQEKSALFQELLKETILAHRDDIEPVINARVMSEARPALEASFPIPSIFYGLAGLFGVFVGIGLALMNEMANQRIRSATELEMFTKAPCYGLSPFHKGLKANEASRYILSSKAVKDAELVRSIRATTNLRAKEGAKPKIITMTSSVPGEGKTTLSTWLSVLSARTGEKVIVIDCDFRKATLHTAFNHKNTVNLVDYLSGETSLEDVIYRQDPSGVHAIFGKNVPGQALELINSKRMRTLIQSLGKAYDLVILDCPTALAVSDALYLAKQSDLTLYNVAWNQTEKETIMAGLKQFKEADIHALAVILSKVDRKQYEHYAQDLRYYMQES